MGTRPSLPGPYAAAAVAFSAGAGVLALEITGARVFVPWFGSSILVWTNVIGVTLGAVAVGNLLGGRLADRRPTSGPLVALLLLAGALAALMPFIVPWLASSYLPPDLSLDSAFALIGRTSLLVALIALGPPLVLLGAASPFLVLGACRDGRVGGAAGLVSGAATAGSLVGAWTPVYFLIPSFGSRATCFIAGAMVAAGAVVAGGSSRNARSTAAVVLVALVSGAFLVDRSVGHGGSADATVLAERETRYQYARVERRGDRVLLKLNEGLDSFHSITVDGDPLTGAYFDYYSLFPALMRPAGRPLDVLILGFAAGTIARQILTLYPDRDVRIVGVEIDPAVAAFGDRFFGLPSDERLDVVTDQDARVYLDHTSERFDLIVVDTYAQQIYVPFQTCSREFFAAAKARLRPDGVLLANLSGFSAGDAPIRAIRNTAAAVFGSVGLLRVERGRNFVLVTSESGEPVDVRGQGHVLPSELRSLAEGAEHPGAFLVYAYDPGDVVLTDDCSPIERLADDDLLEKSLLQLSEASD